MEDQDYILFDQYINGELSAEEIQVFENRINTDKAFDKSFRVFKDASLHLKTTFENEAETNAFKSNLENISNSHFSKTETVTQTQTKTKTFTLIKYLVAASVAIFFGIFAFNQFSNPTYSDYNSHEQMTVVRGEGNVKDLIEATKAFNNKEYEKANTLLKAILEEDPDNTELQLYYAITNIELENFIVADEYLNSLAEGNSGYKFRAIWYSALSQLKQKNNEASIHLLKKIPEEADDYKEAQKLLDKLG